MSHGKHFTWSYLALAVMIYCAPAWANEEFDLQALGALTPLENSETLQNFIDNNALHPGTYLSVIVIAREEVDKRNIRYVLSPDRKKLLPELTKADLRELGVKVDAVPGLRSLGDEALVTDISQYIDQASYQFDIHSHQLTIRIPHLWRDAQGMATVSEKYWDDGLPALLLGYYYSGSRDRDDKSGTSAGHYFNLSPGLNIGAWRLRNNSSYSKDTGWQTMSSWLQRDIRTLKSQFTLGETWTNGELFDSVQFTGAKLETDTSMLPYNQQGFAPTIRGIANSDARITVKQNGYTIYQTWVSPGAFEINDLNQVSAGGDLDVTVTEADGSEHTFTVASASVPVLQRAGAMKYSLAAGRYRSSSDSAYAPDFAQATLVYGLPAGLTVYGGALGANRYQAGLLGMGKDLGTWGGFSFDVTAAGAELGDRDGKSRGTSYRMQYAKNILATNTTLTLASYRYSTAGFYTFQEAIDHQAQADDNDDFYRYRRSNNRRSRIQVNLNQALADWGSIYFNAWQQDYWDLDGQERNLSAGYSTSWLGMSWSFNYSQTQTPNSDTDRQLSLNLSIPLNQWLPDTSANYSMNSAPHNTTSHQLGISGTALENHALSYALQQSYSSQNRQYNASVSGNYHASWGQLGAGYSYTQESQRLNYSLQGGVLAHPYGVTLTPSLNGAVALVHVEGGKNVKVQYGQSLYTDYFGNAVVPWISEYRRNRITVNTESAENVEIPEATRQVVPTDGAVVLAEFASHVGARALVTLIYQGKPVGFGAMVSYGSNNSAIVGDQGEVYLVGINGDTPLSVQWGTKPDQRCTGLLPEPQLAKKIMTATVQCHQG